MNQRQLFERYWTKFQSMRTLSLAKVGSIGRTLFIENDQYYLQEGDTREPIDRDAARAQIHALVTLELARRARSRRKRVR